MNDDLDTVAQEAPEQVAETPEATVPNPLGEVGARAIGFFQYGLLDDARGVANDLAAGKPLDWTRAIVVVLGLAAASIVGLVVASLVFGPGGIILGAILGAAFQVILDAWMIRQGAAK